MLRLECRDSQREPRLAATARAGERHDPLSLQRVAHFANLSIASNERREFFGKIAARRVDGARRGEVVGEFRMAELPHTLEPFETLQPVETEIAPGDAVGGIVDQQVVCRVGDDDLSAVCDRPQPRASDDRGPCIVAFEIAAARTGNPFAAELGLARVQRHTDANRSIPRPHLVAQRSLHVQGCPERIGRAGEHSNNTVALTLLQRPDAAVQHDRRVEQLVVTGDRRRRRVAIGFPHRRRSLDVTEQEGHGTGRKEHLLPDPVVVHSSEVCQFFALRHTRILRGQWRRYICHLAYPDRAHQVWAFPL